ncbi:MAG: ABC transporter substrate-binding protein [Alphaproteobacteria bacterium]|nr:ABC transporter substrate-binding protein [Alphaproteobacteria bacterium]
MIISKRQLLSLACSVAIVAAWSVPAFSQNKDAIKVGVPTALTGPYGDLGNQVRRAVEFAVEEANTKGGVDGRKVEVQFQDTQAKADSARQQGEKLALSGYKLLVGTIASGEGLALNPMLERWDALYISTINKADALTGESCSPRSFRVNHPDYSDASAVGTWLKTQQQGKWAVMGSDTAWGRNSGASFKTTAEGMGKSVVTEGYAALGANDFAPYIQQFVSSGAEGIWVALAGRDAINFAQQAAQFGLLKKVNVAGVSFVTDNTVATLGDVSKGIWGIINYSSTLDTPENKAFVAAWGKKYPGTQPSNFEGETYVGMQVLFQAVTKAKSVKPADVAKAMSGGSFDTVFGKSELRAKDNQLVVPNYFGRVDTHEGGLRPVISLTVPKDVATPGPDAKCKM